MKITDSIYSTYIQILKEELVPAMGCTEPIALAFCAAKAKEVLGWTATKTLDDMCADSWNWQSHNPNGYH